MDQLLEILLNDVFPPYIMFGRCARNNFLERFADFLVVHLGCLGKFVCDGCVGAAALSNPSQRTELALGKLSAYLNHKF